MLAPFEPDRFYGIYQIVGNAKATPPCGGPLSMSVSSFYAGIAAGRFPRPYLIGPNMARWLGRELNDALSRLLVLTADGEASSDTPVASSPKRPRGRPRKYPAVADAADSLRATNTGARP